VQRDAEVRAGRRAATPAASPNRSSFTAQFHNFDTTGGSAIMSARRRVPMARFSPKLTTILLTRGTLRAVLPLYVIWSVWEWALLQPWVAVGFAALTWNYVFVYLMSWFAPPFMNGWWRVRPVQTFVLLGNIVALPIVHYQMRGTLPWWFLGWSLLLIVALYVSTVLQIYLQKALPMGSVFTARKMAGLRKESS
jgi:hypothetical protein